MKFSKKLIAVHLSVFFFLAATSPFFLVFYLGLLLGHYVTSRFRYNMRLSIRPIRKSQSHTEDSNPDSAEAEVPVTTEPVVADVAVEESLTPVVKTRAELPKEDS